MQLQESKMALGACRALLVEAANSAVRGPIFDASPAHGGSMAQEAAETGAAPTDSPPGRATSDRLPVTGNSQGIGGASAVKLAREGARVVVNVSSVHEKLPFPHFTSDAMSKGMSKGRQWMPVRDLAIELAPLGIRGNSIAPGAVQTPINAAPMAQPETLEARLAHVPLERLDAPGDATHGAAPLTSDEAAHVTGTTLFIDGDLPWN